MNCSSMKFWEAGGFFKNFVFDKPALVLLRNYIHPVLFVYAFCTLNLLSATSIINEI